MTDLRQAAQQALEALEDHAEQYPHMQKGYTVDAIAALRAALAQQAEPVEPVGTVRVDAGEVHIIPAIRDADRSALKDGQGVYAAPPRQKVQEPVAWLFEDTLPDEYPYDAMWPYSSVRGGVRMFPVFAPPQRKPLTEEEILRVKGQFRGTMNAQFADFARAIEKAHGIGGQP